MSEMNERRRQLLRVGGAGLIGTGLAGCLGGGDGDAETTTDASGSDDETTVESSDGDETTAESGDETTESDDETAAASESIDVGMVYATGGLGDNSFNDMAHTGVQDAESEYGVTFQNAEPEEQSDVESLQRRFAQSGDYDLICCIGYVQTSALETNAERFADQKFMLVDSVVELDNVSNYTFLEHQGSFQVGHLAGLLTEQEFSAGAGETTDDAVVGFVGGEETPLIKRFEAGYRAGVAHASEDVEVRSAYAGAYNDPGTGQSIANSMYDDGADIVYHAAGGTGNGVFQAAQEQGRFAIGVDADQSESLSEYSDVILASMVKRVDEAVYRSIENVINDQFEGGSVRSLGLERNGVEAVYGQELGSAIPDEVKSALDDSREAIIAGDIEVPTDPGNV